LKILKNSGKNFGFIVKLNIPYHTNKYLDSMKKKCELTFANTGFGRKQENE